MEEAESGREPYSSPWSVVNCLLGSQLTTEPPFLHFLMTGLLNDHFAIIVLNLELFHVLTQEQIPKIILKYP